jgi:hypothetical protein
MHLTERIINSFYPPKNQHKNHSHLNVNEDEQRVK